MSKLTSILGCGWIGLSLKVSLGKELSPTKLIKTLTYSFHKPDVKTFWD